MGGRKTRIPVLREGADMLRETTGSTLIKIAKTARLARLQERRWYVSECHMAYMGEMEYSLWTGIDSETLREAASDNWPRYRVLSLSSYTYIQYTGSGSQT